MLIPFSKFRFQRNSHRDNKAWDRGQQHPDEEMRIADVFLQPAAPHARQHHAQRHETGADGVMCRAVLAARDVNHVKHECGEPEAIAELLDRHARANCQQIVWLPILLKRWLI